MPIAMPVVQHRGAGDHGDPSRPSTWGAALSKREENMLRKILMELKCDVEREEGQNLRRVTFAAQEEAKVTEASEILMRELNIESNNPSDVVRQAAEQLGVAADLPLVPMAQQCLLKLGLAA